MIGIIGIRIVKIVCMKDAKGFINLQSKVWALTRVKFNIEPNLHQSKPELFSFKMHTITYKSRLTQKKLYKKTDAIFSIYG